MVRVVKSTIIDAPVDRVWALLRDFNGHDQWHPAVKVSAIERHLPSDLVGCVRRFQLQDGSELREQLLALSDLEMTFSYCLLDTPVPLLNYVAHVRLLPVTDGNRTFWHWECRFTTPAGRAIDDTEGGDPRSFFSDPDVSTAGWRGNGDTRGGCTHGVNVARNFSSGWSSETSTDCTDDPDGVNDDPADTPGNAVDDKLGDYRGFAPFSTLEATSLRNFVQNRSISMAVVIHSNATKISNLWGAGDVGGTMIADLAKLAWDLMLNDPNLELTRSRSLGSGLGQFSAWLAAPSDTTGQPDRGTARAIQTIFVELPFLDVNLDSNAAVDAYNLGSYRFEAGDGSNGFHPSSSRPVRHVIETSFLFMAEELIREARSLGC